MMVYYVNQFPKVISIFDDYKILIYCQEVIASVMASSIFVLNF